jgi:hypothetical protein
MRRAIQASDTVEIAWSAGLPARAPETIPSTIATGSSTARARPASTAVLISRSPIRVETGCWAVSDRPRLPCRNPHSQEKYRTLAGRSSPSWRLTAASAAGLELRPRIA